MGILTIVQSKTKANNATDGTTMKATFAVAPTNGNQLICIGVTNSGNGVPTANTGWTLQYNSGDTWIVLTKTCGAGESTTQQPVTNGENFWCISMWEISGWTSWASNANVINSGVPHRGDGVGVTTLAVTSFNTSANNELVLGAFHVNNGSADGKRLSLSGTGGAGTTDGQDEGILGGVDFDILSVNWVVATSGTTFNQTITSTISGNIHYTILELQSAAAVVTETGAVTMSLAGVSYNASVHEQENTTSGLALFKASFNVAAGRVESLAGGLALTKVSYNVAAQRIHVKATVTMALNGVAIAASVFDLSAVAALRQFQTFG